ncbi:golgi-body localization protein domain-containing protein [Phakopsora pachyrhizi]|uniref:Golgi-body localisation protein domain-domain-containing protein n=1 Tax=Phakopsora pachyrhizi TaxID=170000 RepID=A0AAV0AVB5_PHAPC|nr:golgi-body localization protein domain-containing protein [Phakopsora pachyrhizi]CAH7672088.1 golgi-body localisation protein domain-domain-containing protein [Phakopsora pachyrhizi]
MSGLTSKTVTAMLLIFILLSICTIYFLLPRIIRKYATKIKIGQIGLFSLKDVEWRGRDVRNRGNKADLPADSTPKPEEPSHFSLGSIGLRFGTSEGDRRQWIVLRIDSVRIKIPHLHTESQSFKVPDQDFVNLTKTEATDVCDDLQSFSWQINRGSERSSSPAYDCQKLNTLKELYKTWTTVTKSNIRRLPYGLKILALLHLKAWRLARVKIAKPLLNKINQLGRRLSWIISVFGLEINNFEVEVLRICKIKGSFKLGFQLSRGSNSHLCCWLILKNPQMHQVFKSSRPMSAENFTENFTDDNKSHVISFPGCIEMSASAGLDPVIGIASILVHSSKPGRHPFTLSSSRQYTQSLKKSLGRIIRPHSIDLSLRFSENSSSKSDVLRKFGFRPKKETLASVFISAHRLLDVLRSFPRQNISTKRHCSNEFSSSYQGLNTPSAVDSFHTEQDGAKKASKISFLSSLRHVQVEVPYLHCFYHLGSAHSAPVNSDLLNSMSGDIQNMTAYIKISGLFSNLDLSEEKKKLGSDRSTHTEWFGRNTSVPLRFKSSCKEIEVGIRANIQPEHPEESTTRNSTQLLKISETFFALSSTWIPDSVRAKLSIDGYQFSSMSYIRFSGDHNDHMVVAELEIGKVEGKISTSDIISLLAFFSNLPKKSSSEPRRNDSHSKNLPRYVIGVTVHSISYDFCGASCSSFEERTHLGEKSTIMLSLDCSSFQLNSSGQYVDLTLKRSDFERREAKKKARRAEVYVPHSLRKVQVSPAHEEAVLFESGSSSLKSNLREFSVSEKSCTHGIKANLVERIQSERGNAGPFTQAFPLPVPSSDIQFWESRVEIFRGMNFVDFMYELSFKCKTGYIDVVFEDSSSRRALDERTHVDPPFRSTDGLSNEILSLLSLEIDSQMSFAGWNSRENGKIVPVIKPSNRDGEFLVSIGTVALDLWQPSFISFLKHLLHVLAVLRANWKDKNITQPESLAPRAQSIPQDIAFSLTVSKVGLRFAGSDSNKDLSDLTRGVRIEVSSLSIEAYHQSSAQFGLYSCPDRLRLDLKEDIRVQANSRLLQNPEFNICLFKYATDTFRIVPEPDVTSRLHDHLRDGPDLPQIRSPSLWELKNRYSSLAKPSTSFSSKPKLDEGEYEKDRDEQVGDAILVVERLAFRMTLQALKNCTTRGDDELIVVIECCHVKIHLDVFSIYCSLLGLSEIFTIWREYSEFKKGFKEASKIQGPRRVLHVGIRAEFQTAHAQVFLSPKVPIFVEIRRISIQKSKKLGLDVRWDTSLLAARSVTCPGLWDDILKIKTFKLKIVEVNRSHQVSNSQRLNRGWHPFIIVVEGDAARFRIPFKFVIAEVLESISIMNKTLKQIFTQFVRGRSNSNTEPVAESPKKIPEIRIKFRIVALQAEDDPFENKLNAIRRAGKEEVKDRLARDESFERRAQELRAAGNYRVFDNISQRERFFRKDRSPSRSNFSGENKERNSYDSSCYSQDPSLDSRATLAEVASRLDAYNAAAWINRIRNALAEQERQEDTVQRQLYGHVPTKPKDPLPIELNPLPKATPLVRVVLHNIQISLYKADFEKSDMGLQSFLNRVGKGLPKDTNFTLIIPMHISWQMEGAIVRLRDFPLNLFSLPRPQVKKDSQERDSSQSTWQMETEFVIAEEMSGKESVRLVPSLIIPKRYTSTGEDYVIDVLKTAMPTKTYAEPIIKIKPNGPVRIGWGNSMQPAVQDMMRVLDSISKPSIDPSERVGFWDKIRLSLHWKIEINLVGNNSDLVLHLKGLRDPYELLGNGAGFAKVWRGNVKLLLGHQNEEREFLQIKSDRFILGIPNLKDLINNAATGSAPSILSSSADSYKRHYQEMSNAMSLDDEDDNDAFHAFHDRKTEFLKIVGNLTNGVKWGMGIILERACAEGEDQICGCSGPAFHRKCRFFTFKPHYQVVTKTPKFAVSPGGKNIDSYQGFRSDFIHFSISLTSTPESGSYRKQLSSQNSLYFSPEAFTHFWSWWKTFDSSLSLPIRQGKLFSSAQAPSKKFGRHVATIKFRFGISPLFMAHTYKSENSLDWVKGRSIVLGFKAKISKFNVDLHARAVETTIRKPEMKEPQKIIRKAFDQAEIDCQDVEIRAISAVFMVPRKAKYAADIGLKVNQDELDVNSIWEEDFGTERDETGVDFSSSDEPHTLDSHKIKAKDRDWIDLDDFTDLYFWPYNSSGEHPQIRMYDCVLCPRISFLRRPSSTVAPSSGQAQGSNNGTDTDSTTDGQPVIRTKFGTEDTHTCFIGKADDPMDVQVGLLELRLRELEDEKYRCLFSEINHKTGNSGLKLQQIETRIETLKELKCTIIGMKDISKPQGFSSDGNGMFQSQSIASESPYWAEGRRYFSEMAKQSSDESSDWSNRLLVHNPSILISNLTRDILLKYYFSYSQRRGYMYHISARAVKFILDLADQKPSSSKMKPDSSKRKSRMRSQDFRSFHESIDPSTGKHKSTSTYSSDLSPDELAERDIPADFVVDSSDLILLLQPQIAFRSNVDDVSTVILTAFHAQLKCFEVLDSSHIDDPVNAKVMRRYFGTVLGFQMFYPNELSLITQSSPRYGTLGHQCLVPLEVLVDLRLETTDFDRLIGRCTVDVAYDAFNQLRIRRRSAGADSSFSTASQPHLRSSTDLLRVETADPLSVHATATHYRAMYNVITDLCFYMDPAQKKRNDALETMQFAYDVDDLAGMAKQIQLQQSRIRLHRRKLAEGRVHLNIFDTEQMADLTHREYQLLTHASDLNLMVEAIRKSQASRLDRSRSENLSGTQLQTRAKVITWHMLADGGDAIAKLSITDTRFDRYSLPDTSASNRLFVQEMLALNISADPDRLFDEILSRYEPQPFTEPLENPKNFLIAVWKTLPPIAGIPIVESFLLDIHPIRLQIEHAIGIKVHDYLFGHKSSGESDGEHTTKTLNIPSPNWETASVMKRARTVSQPMKAHKLRHPFLDSTATSSKRSVFNLGSTNSQESLHSNYPKQQHAIKVWEGPTFLNPEWRSNSASGVVGPKVSLNASARLARAPSISSFSSGGHLPDLGINSNSNGILFGNKQKTENAAEMKKRAQLYKSFLFIDVTPTILCVSYSGPKYPDIFDLVVKVPPFHLESRTWSYSEFFDELRKTCVSSLFKQSPSILGQIITTARKNKSVPKIVGQKVASGFKFRKKSIFERSTSLRSQPQPRSPLTGTIQSPKSAKISLTDNGNSITKGKQQDEGDDSDDNNDYRWNRSHIQLEPLEVSQGPSFFIQPPSGVDEANFSFVEGKLSAERGTPRPTSKSSNNSM